MRYLVKSQISSVPNREQNVVVCTVALSLGLGFFDCLIPWNVGLSMDTSNLEVGIAIMRIDLLETIKSCHKQLHFLVIGRITTPCVDVLAKRHGRFGSDVGLLNALYRHPLNWVVDVGGSSGLGA
jgi:hypothetical protein